jgi:hypothetical protein
LLVSMKKETDWKTERVKSLENELSESIRKTELIEKDNLKFRGDLEWARDYCQTVNNKIKELEKQLNLTNYSTLEVTHSKGLTPVLQEVKPTISLTPVLPELRSNDSQIPAIEPQKTIKYEPNTNSTPSTPKQTVSPFNNIALERISSVTKVATPGPRIKKEETIEPVAAPLSLPSCSIHLVPGKRIEPKMARYTVTSTSPLDMTRKSLTSMSGKSFVAEEPRKSLDSSLPVRKIERPLIDLTIDETVEEMGRKSLESVPAKTLPDVPRKRGRPRKIVK